MVIWILRPASRRSAIHNVNTDIDVNTKNNTNVKITTRYSRWFCTATKKPRLEIIQTGACECH